MSLNDLSLYPLKLSAGTVGAPSLYFSTDTTTGIFRPAANQIGVTVSGTLRLLVSSSGTAITGVQTITNSGSQAYSRITTYRDAAALTRIEGQSARGTLAVPANLDTSDEIFSLICRAWEVGSTFTQCGLLRFVATQDHEENKLGTKFQVYVTADDAETVSLGLEIGQDRVMTIPGGIKHTGSTLGFFNKTPVTQQSKPSDAPGIIALLVAYGLCPA